MKKPLLGDMLIAEGLITPEQRDEALADQKRVGKRFGEVLVSRGLVTDEVVARFLSKQLGLQYMDMNAVRVDPVVLQMVPQKIARKHKALPIERSDGGVLVAMADPLDVFAMDEIKRNIRTYKIHKAEHGPGGARSLPMPTIDIAVAPESQLLKAINRHYAEDIAKAPAEEEVAGAEDTPVVKLVNSLMNQAVEYRASDIHVEPGTDVLRVRFRVDGILHEVMSPPKSLHAGLVSRVKTLSGMDIAEKRVPQDGRFDAGVAGRQFDVRASTLPTMYGADKQALRLPARHRADRMRKDYYDVFLAPIHKHHRKKRHNRRRPHRVRPRRNKPGAGQPQGGPQLHQRPAFHPQAGPRRHNDRRDKGL
jgi:type IV pilus assembly protein PilB